MSLELCFTTNLGRSGFGDLEFPAGAYRPEWVQLRGALLAPFRTASLSPPWSATYLIDTDVYNGFPSDHLPPFGAMGAAPFCPKLRVLTAWLTEYT